MILTKFFDFLLHKKKPPHNNIIIYLKLHSLFSRCKNSFEFLDSEDTFLSMRNMRIHSVACFKIHVSFLYEFNLPSSKLLMFFFARLKMMFPKMSLTLEYIYIYRIMIELLVGHTMCAYGCLFSLRSFLFLSLFPSRSILLQQHSNGNKTLWPALFDNTKYYHSMLLLVTCSLVWVRGMNTTKYLQQPGSTCFVK